MRWQRPEILDRQASFVFRIIVPESELRVIDINESLNNVHWIPSPGLGKVQLVECYLSPPTAGLQMNFPFPHLASLDLPNLKLFVLLAHDEVVTDEQKNQMTALREKAKASALEHSIALRPEFRGVGFTEGDQGERGMIEFVPAAT